MITITVDLREATKEEAEAYSKSKTQEFLLNQTPRDLAGTKLTIRMDAGSHFQEQYELPSTEEDTFATFDVVIAKVDPLQSLLALRTKHSVAISARSIAAIDVKSYEAVPSYEHPGSPHARLTLYSGEVIYVKQHVTTVVERLKHAGASIR